MDLDLFQQRGILLELMITRKCNFFCGHCMYDCSPQSSNEYMSDEILNKIKNQVDFLKNVDIPATVNILGGEPTINFKKFEHILKIVSTWNTPITLNTNGWWLSSEDKTEKFFKIVSPYINENGKYYTVSNFKKVRIFLIRISNDPYHYTQRKVKNINEVLWNIFNNQEFIKDWGVPIPDDVEPWIYAQPVWDKNWIVSPNGRARNLSPININENFCFLEKYNRTESIHYEPDGNITDACGWGSIYDFGNVNDNILFIIEIIRQYKEYRKNCGKIHNCYNCREMVQDWKKENLIQMRDKYKELNTFNSWDFLYNIDANKSNIL